MHDIELGYFKIETEMLYLYLVLKSNSCIRTRVPRKSARWKECKHEHLGAVFVSFLSFFYLHVQPEAPRGRFDINKRKENTVFKNFYKP